MRTPRQNTPASISAVHSGTARSLPDLNIRISASATLAAMPMVPQAE